MATLLLSSLSVVSQRSPSNYASLIQTADSFFYIKQYLPAADHYSKAFQLTGAKISVSDRYKAADAWALCGFPDSAFFNLEKIVFAGTYTSLNTILQDDDLLSLHNSDRWPKLIEKIKQNKVAVLKKDRLILLLDSLKEEDQKWRAFHRRQSNKELSQDSISPAYVSRHMRITDSLNCIEVRKILKEFGYPNEDMAGSMGTNNFWLLVQHQDNRPLFQDSVLVLMKKEVDNGKVSATNYAYLFDRVQVNLGKKQVYGTQMTLNKKGTSYEPRPVIDPKKLNARRKSMGLGTEEEYIRVMNERYYGTLGISDL